MEPHMLKLLLVAGRPAYDALARTLDSPALNGELWKAWSPRYQELAEAILRQRGSIDVIALEGQLTKEGKKALNAVQETVLDMGQEYTQKRLSDAADRFRTYYALSLIASSAEHQLKIIDTGAVTDDVLDTALQQHRHTLRRIQTLGARYTSHYAADIAVSAGAQADAVAAGTRQIAMSTGYSKLNEESLLMEGEPLLITAMPKNGKTALAMAIARHRAEECKRLGSKCVVIFSMEMTQHKLFFRNAAARASFDLTKLNRGRIDTTSADWQAFRADIDEQGTLPFLIIPDAGLTGVDMEDWGNIYNEEFGGVDTYVLDYASLARTSQKANNDYERIKWVFREFSYMVKNTVNADGSRPAGIIINELRRAGYAGNKMPDMDDVKQAGEFESGAGIVPLRWQDYKKDPELLKWIESDWGNRGRPLHADEHLIKVLFNRNADMSGLVLKGGFRFVGKHTRWEQGEWE